MIPSLHPALPALAAAALVAPAPPSNQEPEAPAIVLRDVIVVDVQAGKLSPAYTVVIRGERIAAVTPAAEAEVPEGARVVDGKGGFLIPGLWDMHVHALAAPPFARLFVANGVTGVRDLFTQGDIDWLRSKFLSGEDVGPRLIAAGPIVDGEDPVWPGSVEARTPEEGRAAVTKVRELGADFVKVYSKLSRETYLAIAAEARAQGMPFDGHVPPTVRAGEAAAAGQRCIEHLTGVLAASSSEEESIASPDLGRMERTRLGLDTYDAEKAQALFEVFVEHGTWHCPTLTVLRSISRLDDPEIHEDERLAYLPEFWKHSWNPANDFRFRSYDDDHWETARAGYAKSLELVGDMHRAGVRLLAGTDCANPYCFPGFSLHDELGLLVEAGLTPAEALRTATWNPAVFLGRTDELGSVAPGKLADLVLLEDDPLQDIAHTRGIRAVVANGRLFEEDDLSALLGD